MSEIFHKLILARHILAGWGCLVGLFFLIAEVKIWKETGINVWNVWWQTDTDSIKTERRFSPRNHGVSETQRSLSSGEVRHSCRCSRLYHLFADPHMDGGN